MFLSKVPYLCRAAAVVRDCSALPDICACQEATAAVLQVAPCASQGLPALQRPKGIVS